LKKHSCVFPEYKNCYDFLTVIFEKWVVAVPVDNEIGL